MTTTSHKYLTKEILVGFDKYKYNAVDTSPVSVYVTHPIWNRAVQILPMWIAPNLLTFAGLLFLVLQMASTAYYDPYFHASSDNPQGSDQLPVPAWIWLVSTICLLMSYGLDSVDGKQARRTGCTGPLGELFDHGVDSWDAVFWTANFASLVGRGDFGLEVRHVMMMLVLLQVTALLGDLEKYNTGTFTIPWVYDAGMLILLSFNLTTYIAGYQVWKFRLPLLGYSPLEVFLYAVCGSVIFHTAPVSVWETYQQQQQGGVRTRGFYEAIRPVIPSSLLYVLLAVWATHSPSDIMNKEPRLFMLVCAAVFSNIEFRLIVAGMSYTRATVFNALLVPLVVIVPLVCLVPMGAAELWLLWIYTILALAADAHYAICVVQELASHLNIYVFSTSKPEAKQK